MSAAKLDRALASARAGELAWDDERAARVLARARLEREGDARRGRLMRRLGTGAIAGLGVVLAFALAARASTGSARSSALDALDTRQAIALGDGGCVSD